MVGTKKMKWASSIPNATTLVPIMKPSEPTWLLLDPENTMGLPVFLSKPKNGVLRMILNIPPLTANQ